jgi:hypothetical protein
MIDRNLEGDHPVWRTLFDMPQRAAYAGYEDDKEYAIVTNDGSDVYDRQMRNPENKPHWELYRHVGSGYVREAPVGACGLPGCSYQSTHRVSQICRASLAQHEHMQVCIVSEHHA